MLKHVVHAVLNSETLETAALLNSTEIVVETLVVAIQGCTVPASVDSQAVLNSDTDETVN